MQRSVKPEATIYTDRVSTGVPGFDSILNGGLIPARTYLLSGAPGTGKTTLGWHFLTAGARADDVSLYVSFAEPEAQLRRNAAGIGLDVDRVHVIDLSPSSDIFTQAEVYDLFSAHDVEREPTTARIVEAIERLEPNRVFVDSMTSLRFLTTDAFQFRRQALSFLRFLAARNATVLVTSESTVDTPDDDLRFLVDGVIELALDDRTWSVSVRKFRGSGFRNGRHGMRLTPAGAEIFPRLLPQEYTAPVNLEKFSTGITMFDTMLGGGIEKGTITLLSGPTGVGKSTLAAACLAAIAASGVPSMIYTFDERPETILRRCEALQMDLQRFIDAGLMQIRGIEALRFGSDEFAMMLRDDIESFGTKAIVIDSISGYRMTIAGDDLVERLHAIGRYLQNIGVTLFLVDELRDLSQFRASDASISYLADNAIFLRYIERREGEGITLRKGIGVLKKRLSDFDKSLREFTVGKHGVDVGEAIPLRSLFTPMMALESSSD